MTAGRLRNRVWVQAPLERRAAGGQVVAEFRDLYRRYAAVESLSGAELVRAQQVQASVTHKVTMRSDAATRALQPKFRLRLGPRHFGVLWVDQVEQRNREVRAYCAEEVRDGATGVV